MSAWWEDPDVADWQHGLCDTYAKALLDTYPHLRLGLLIEPETECESHYFVHDDSYAYDSIGRHPLPYTGYGENAGTYEHELDVDPADYGIGSHYPYGENGGEAEYARATALIPAQHPWFERVITFELNGEKRRAKVLGSAVPGPDSQIVEVDGVEYAVYAPLGRVLGDPDALVARPTL